MIERRASCQCGALTAVARGEPARISVCHCLDCKKRSGSAFAYGATYPEERVEASGPAKTFRRVGDEGFWGEFSFCPDCGSTVTYRIERRPGMLTVPVGAFADPDFPEPTVSVYGERRHKWCVLATQGPVAKL
ncbi:MAG TPA: GFA family protein [Allosphingosinicella sp.]|nr:GFA family protein [Allosphingosinicella sp.]